jgi:energy-coupling factor transporter ATP-binding protein EcfA2
MVNMTYFRLENSSIFYNNFNLSVFEFDRRKSKNNLVLIVGKNGSGKSALATELSPFPNELTRGATERFVEGTDGRKVLEFQNENSSWLCEIIYPAGKGTQCFIKKTDRKTGTTQELNENGNVRSYLECLEKEFGLSKNYTNVGYFSEEVLNVVNMTPTVRNSLISSFLPDTAEPIDAFKVVQRKYNQVRKECDNLEDDIKKIVINEYQIELEQAEINLVSKEKRLIYVREKLSEGRLYQNQNRAVTKGAVRMEIDKFLYDVKKFNENTAELTELIRSTNDYSGREKRLDEDILSVRDKMARNSTTLSYLDEEVGKLTTSVNMMQRNINRVNVDESIPVILMSIAEKEREQDAIVTELSKMTKNYPYERFDVNYNESTALTIVNSTLLQIYHMIEKLTSMKTEFSVNDIIEKPNEVRQSIEERLNRERSKIRKIKEKIANLEQRERTLRGAGLTKDILDFIPVGCSKDTCSLIRELYNYIDASSALGEIVKEKEMLYELERSINEHIETGVQRENSWISNMFLLVDQINDNVYQNRSHISRLHQNIRDKINVPLPQLVANIDAIMDMIKGWQNYISLEDKLRSIDTALTSLRVKKEQIDIEVSKNKELQRLRVEFEAATTRDRKSVV